ncbi:MAG: DUF1801 domain-containing protein [Gammaproteobacteria bacterium]|nr:DUF1801 domain-containing protein [Gammaproteobacteria bacterium]
MRSDNQQPVPSPPPDVAAAFASYPRAVRSRLTELRTLIFEVAASEDVGAITETLKWGEPAYLTAQSKSGSTLRMGWKVAAPEQYAVYFNCQTTLVDTFRTLFPELRFDGNRAILLDASKEPPMDSLAVCIAATLTYHRAKKTRRDHGK